MSVRVEAVRAAFARRHGAEPAYVVSAPGRVNLLGEHTDYNDGFVFPVAIDREMLIAATPHADRKDGRVRVYSLDYDAEDRFDLASPLVKSAENPWADYMRAVFSVFVACAFKTRGLDAVISGDVPQGAGLSSSAAYEVAVATLVNAMTAGGIAPRQLALLAQKAENRFVGVQCGIMDQFVSALGRPDAALLIDCRSLDYRPVPLELEARGLAIVVVNSGVKRGLVDSEYNARREECQAGTALLAERLRRPEIRKLRDVSFAEFERHAADLPARVARRVRHVVGENERVLAGVEALERGDVEAFGRQMDASHASLRDDFEVSCPELDRLVELARAHAGVLGARMTGAGFGGCAVALVSREAVPEFEARVIPAYEAATGRRAEVYVCKAMGGARVLASPPLA